MNDNNTGNEKQEILNILSAAAWGVSIILGIIAAFKTDRWYNAIYMGVATTFGYLVSIIVVAVIVYMVIQAILDRITLKAFYIIAGIVGLAIIVCIGFAVQGKRYVSHDEQMFEKGKKAALEAAQDEIDYVIEDIYSKYGAYIDPETGDSLEDDFDYGSRMNDIDDWDDHYDFEME